LKIPANEGACAEKQMVVRSSTPLANSSTSFDPEEKGPLPSDGLVAVRSWQTP